jgi:hypothetical protein
VASQLLLSADRFQRGEPRSPRHLLTHGPIRLTLSSRRTRPSARPDWLAEPIVRNELVENE